MFQAADRPRPSDGHPSRAEAGPRLRAPWPSIGGFRAELCGPLAGKQPFAGLTDPSIGPKRPVGVDGGWKCLPSGRSLDLVVAAQGNPR